MNDIIISLNEIGFWTYVSTIEREIISSALHLKSNLTKKKWIDDFAIS